MSCHQSLLFLRLPDLYVEVSEVLSVKYKVSLVANVVAKEIYTLCKKHGISVSNEPEKFDLREFDFVWA